MFKGRLVGHKHMTLRIIIHVENCDDLAAMFNQMKKKLNSLSLSGQLFGVLFISDFLPSFFGVFGLRIMTQFLIYNNGTIA